MSNQSCRTKTLFLPEGTPFKNSDISSSFDIWDSFYYIVPPTFFSLASYENHFLVVAILVSTNYETTNHDMKSWVIIVYTLQLYIYILYNRYDTGTILFIRKKCDTMQLYMLGPPPHMFCTTINLIQTESSTNWFFNVGSFQKVLK